MMKLQGTLVPAFMAISVSVSTGCAAGYANQSTLERDDRSPRQCYARCQEAGMRMAGYVFMARAATACVCAMEPAQGRAEAVGDEQVVLAGAAAAADLLRQQQEAAETAQRQQRQGQASTR